ncbi:hypothetical protein BDF19DRAFT_389272 [Syncephalis fuscata]|nr:hypothetical protein BDF19DRAFT_389272 [Syncephalis fuscata]
MSTTSFNNQQELVKRTHLSTPLAVYNSKLEKLRSQSKYVEFWNVVDELKEKGLKPDAVTWNAMISMRSASGEWRIVYNLLKEMRAAGYKPSTATYYDLLKHNTRRYDAKENETIIENMRLDEVPIRASAYDQIIMGRSRMEPEHALRTLKEMKVRGMMPLPSTYLSVIRAFCNINDAKTALDVLREAERQGNLPVISYFYVLDLCANNDDLEGALYCWNHLIRNKMHVHEGACLPLLRLAANAGDGALAGDILRHLTQQKYELTAIHFEPLFAALVNSDDMAAFGVLNLMEKAKIPISQEFVNAWTTRLAISKDMLEKGFRLLERIHNEGNDTGARDVHVALFNSVLIAGVRLRDPERVADIFQQAGKLETVPNIDSYHALMDACKIAQQPATAAALLDEMRDNNVPIVRATYERLIGAFCGVTAGDSYEEAFQYLEEAKAAGFVPTESMYVMIVRKCARERDPRANIAMEEMAAFGYPVGKNLQRYVEAGGINELVDTLPEEENDGNYRSRNYRNNRNNNYNNNRNNNYKNGTNLSSRSRDHSYDNNREKAHS